MQRFSFTLTRKLQEENLWIFLNQKAFPLKFTQLRFWDNLLPIS